MKKYLSLVLIFIVSLLALGCGEQTFDDIIYTDITGLQEVATVAETYNVSKTNTMELNVVYNTTLTLTIDNVTYTREIKTTIGELARKGIFQTEIVCKKGDEIERTICQTCYDGDIYTMFKYEDGNVQKSHDTYSPVTNSTEPISVRISAVEPAPFGTAFSKSVPFMFRFAALVELVFT